MRHTEDSDTRAEIELRSGLIHYQQDDFLLAATQFDAAAARSAQVRPVATFDAALSWLGQRNFDRFRTELKNFTALQPASPLHAELMLEEGLAQARQRSPEARQSLESFLRLFPHAPRLGEARLALAELTFLAPEASPQLREEAAQAVRTIVADPSAPEVAAQADYLAIWMSEAREPRDSTKVIALGRAFLQKHPQSPWVPAVQMKLGQIFFNREDFANAETYFTEVARTAPASPLAESSLFLAGQAAAKLMNPGAVDRAFAAFDAVIARNGPLKLYARQEQANIQSRLSKEDQALALYDLILAAVPPPDPQLREAAYCGKADSLLSLGRRENAKERIAAAIAVYDELAQLPGVSPSWRNQALFKKGKALEQVGRNDDAILAYYDVLNRSAAADREYFWLYKAGFDLARIFEQQEQWKSAIGIYEKMAAFEGPRSAEARTRLRQLRLERFLWE